MGLTQRLGTIPLAIQTDSSNNVGIGGAANASYKLAVTGASLFSSSIGATSATFSDTVAITLTASDSRILGGNSTGRLLLGNSGTSTYGIIYGATHATFPNAIQFVNNNTASLTLASNGMLSFEGTGNTIPLRFQDISAAITGQTAGYIGMSTSAFSGNNGDLVLYPRTSATSRILLMGGNVGIGTTSPNSLLDVKGANPFIRITDSAGSGDYGFIMDAGGGFIRGGLTINSSTGEYKSFCGVTGNSYFQTFLVNGSERMRIPIGGGLCVGGTSFSGLNTAVSVNSASNSGFIVQTGGTNRGYFYTSGNNTYIETTNSGLLYCWVNGANGVYLTAGSTSWTANSDERLKDITGNIENAVDSLLTLRTVKHTWKTDEDKTEHLALIAQDVEKVLPQLIDKYIIPAKRGEEQIDKTEYLGVRYTELIPVLVKAIQELNAKVTALENK